jgi:hypothetical protein
MGTTQYHRQWQRLRSRDLAAIQSTDEVTTADEQLAAARQVVATLTAEEEATQAKATELDHTLARLRFDSARGHVEAAAAIPATEQAAWHTERHLKTQLPDALALAHKGVQDAEAHLTACERRRDIALNNELEVQRQAANQQIEAGVAR